MSDFARLSTGRKVAMFVAAIVVLGLLYWRLVYTGLGKDADAAKTAYNAAAKKNEKLEQDMVNHKALLAEKERLNADFLRMQCILPTKAEVPAFFETIERKLTDAGFGNTDVKFTTKPEETFDQFVKVPLQVEIVGNFMQIKRFFASLLAKRQRTTITPNQAPNECERIASIENLAITNPTLRNNRELVLTARFLAVTFRQQQAAPAPQGAPNALPSDAPAPANVGAQPEAPLPTPGEVKSRVDDSMKKSEERIERGTRDPGRPGSNK